LIRKDWQSITRITRVHLCNNQISQYNPPSAISHQQWQRPSSRPRSPFPYICRPYSNFLHNKQQFDK
jgi:hypothetical protein